MGLKNNEPEKYFGHISATRMDRGFFFIRYYVGKVEHDIFAHISQVLPGSAQPMVGQRVLFSIGIDSKRQKEQAIQIDVLPPPSQSELIGG